MIRELAISPDFYLLQVRRADSTDSQSTTTSLSESIYNYRQEHGRTYHCKFECSESHSSRPILTLDSLQGWTICLPERRGMIHPHLFYIVY